MIYQTFLVTFTRTDHSIPVSLINAFHEACKDLTKFVIMCEIKKKQYRVLPMYTVQYYRQANLRSTRKYL